MRLRLPVLLLLSLSGARPEETQARVIDDAVVARLPRRTVGARIALLTDDGGPLGFGRLGAACFARSGVLAVLSLVPPRVLIFDARGGGVRTLGRSGAGPGEFREPQGLSCLAADSVVVLEIGRVSTFALGGTAGTSERFAASSERVAIPLGRLDGGITVARSSVPRPRQPGAQRDSLELEVHAPRAAVRPLGRFGGGEVVHVVHGQATTTAVSPFGATLLVTTDEAHVHFMDTAVSDLHSVALPGGPTRQVQFRLTPRPLPRSVVEAERERRVSRARPAELAFQRAIAAALPAPAFLPLFDRMLALGDGQTALRRFRLADDTEAEWVVVDARGRASARWQLPASLRVLAATAERIVGVEADADGVESLVGYALR